jgi:hypothetical protein
MVRQSGSELAHLVRNDESGMCADAHHCRSEAGSAARWGRRLSRDGPLVQNPPIPPTGCSGATSHASGEGSPRAVGSSRPGGSWVRFTPLRPVGELVMAAHRVHDLPSPQVPSSVDIMWKIPSVQAANPLPPGIEGSAGGAREVASGCASARALRKWRTPSERGGEHAGRSVGWGSECQIAPSPPPRVVSPTRF